MVKGGNTGPAIVAGKSAESRLIAAVTWAAGAPKMPSGEAKLPDREVAILRAWIDQGAKAPANESIPRSKKLDHWAFQQVKRSPLPSVSDANWCRNPIDRFILARLDADRIVPAPEADRTTLARRLYLDMLGLPPTPEEINAFVADQRPDAYERLVGRVLASP